MTCPECGSEDVAPPNHDDYRFGCVECGHIWDSEASLELLFQWIVAHPGHTAADMPRDTDACAAQRLHRAVALLRDQGHIVFHRADRVQPQDAFLEGGWFACQEKR